MKEHFTVKELPDSEKPYEKFLKYGAAVLSDAELLAVIIKSGANGIKSIEVAQNFLNTRERNLLNLYEMPFDEMLALRGIGKVKAIQLKCVAELSRRIAGTKYRYRVSLKDASSVAGYYMERLRHERQEHVLLAMFDAKCCLTGECVIAVGSINRALIMPREIFLKALNSQAVYIILLHNHPSGFPEPSDDDDEITMRLCECGQLLGIELADHIIIGDNVYYSYREHKKIF